MNIVITARMHTMLIWVGQLTLTFPALSRFSVIGLRRKDHFYQQINEEIAFLDQNVLPS